MVTERLARITANVVLVGAVLELISQPFIALDKTAIPYLTGAVIGGILALTTKWYLKRRDYGKAYTANVGIFMLVAGIVTLNEGYLSKLGLIIFLTGVLISIFTLRKRATLALLAISGIFILVFGYAQFPDPPAEIVYPPLILLVTYAIPVGVSFYLGYKWRELYSQALERENSLRQEAERLAQLAKTYGGAISHGPLRQFERLAQLAEAGRTVDVEQLTMLAREFRAGLQYFRAAIAGGVEVNPSRITLTELLTEISPQGVTINGDATVTTDAELLKSILDELIQNALKYSDGKTVILLVSGTGTNVSVSVTDQGIGIPQDDLERVFEVGQRASNVGSVKGTGFGLPLCREYARILGGELTVESEIGKGSTFTLVLPLVKEESLVSQTAG